jgi:hypothetical protein
MADWLRFLVLDFLTDMIKTVISIFFGSSPKERKKPLISGEIPLFLQRSP